MPLRLLEMLIPAEKKEEAERILADDKLARDFWYELSSEGMITVKVIVRAEESQNLLDTLDDNFSELENYKLVLYPLAAVMPIPEEKEGEEGGEEVKSEEEKAETPGISREELYADLSERCEVTGAYLTLMALSAIVASVGVLRNDIAVIIGAMVIAPVIGPNMGLSLATTTADLKLGKKSLRTIMIGIVLIFVISVLLGWFLSVDVGLEFIQTRTEVGLADVGLALASGSAGAIALTREISTALVGVMVSIALVPTLVASGLLLGDGYVAMAGAAAVLYLINLTCVNLAGVSTFLVEGIKPKSWWQAKKARRLSKWAVAIWMAILALLVALILYLQWL